MVRPSSSSNPAPPLDLEPDSMTPPPPRPFLSGGACCCGGGLTCPAPAKGSAHCCCWCPAGVEETHDTTNTQSAAFSFSFFFFFPTKQTVIEELRRRKPCGPTCRWVVGPVAASARRGCSRRGAAISVGRARRASTWRSRGGAGLATERTRRDTRG